MPTEAALPQPEPLRPTPGVGDVGPAIEQPDSRAIHDILGGDSPVSPSRPAGLVGRPTRIAGIFDQNLGVPLVPSAASDARIPSEGRDSKPAPAHPTPSVGETQPSVSGSGNEVFVGPAVARASDGDESNGEDQRPPQNVEADGQQPKVVTGGRGGSIPPIVPGAPRAEMPPPDKPRPSLDTQQLELNDIQRVHGQALRASGAAAVARDVVFQRGVVLDLDNALVQTRVIEARISGGENTIGAPGIEFAATTINKSGYQQTAYYPVPLMHLVDGFPVLAEGFTGDHLTQVEGMLDGLREAQRSGRLPDLSAQYTELMRPGGLAIIPKE